MVQQLGLCASTSGGMGPIPGWGTKILEATRHSPQNKIKRQMDDVKLQLCDQISFLFFLIFKLFIYFWLCWVFIATQAFL